MIKQAKVGHVVNEEEIPPPVAVTVTRKLHHADEPAPDNTGTCSILQRKVTLLLCAIDLFLFG